MHETANVNIPKTKTVNLNSFINIEVNGKMPDGNPKVDITFQALTVEDAQIIVDTCHQIADNIAMNLAKDKARKAV